MKDFDDTPPGQLPVDATPNDATAIGEYTVVPRKEKCHCCGMWGFIIKYDGIGPVCHDCYNPNRKQFIRSEPKIGRNDPCPCGSGKKNKKCCNK